MTSLALWQSYLRSPNYSYPCGRDSSQVFLCQLFVSSSFFSFLLTPSLLLKTFPIHFEISSALRICHRLLTYNSHINFCDVSLEFSPPYDYSLSLVQVLSLLRLHLYTAFSFHFLLSLVSEIYSFEYSASEVKLLRLLLKRPS